MVRTAWAFITRDFLLTVSYRAAFAGQILLILVGVSLLYYLGKVVDSSMNPLLKAYAGDYFAFLLIGVALSDFMKVSLATLNTSIRESQMMGTLEIILLSPLRVMLVLIYSCLWSYIFASIRFGIYLLVGFALYGFEPRHANYLGALLVLSVSIVCFTSFGMMTAAALLVFKRGDTSMFMSIAAVFLGGVMFPVDMLPTWLQALSSLLPITHTLTGMRQAVMLGYPVSRLLPEVGALLLLTLLLFPLGAVSVAIATRRAKISGTLAHY